MKCNIEESIHQPTSDDLENGIPKHSVPTMIRNCMDSRKSDCIYFKTIFDETENYTIALNACLYGYRKEQ